MGVSDFFVTRQALMGSNCALGTAAVLEALEARLLLDGTSYLVNSLADVVASDGVVTLREAMEAANRNAAVTADVLAGSAVAADRITFDQAALQAKAGPGNPLTIMLGGASLVITDDLAIEGLGPDVLRIDAGGRSRVFRVSGAETSWQERPLNTWTQHVAQGVQAFAFWVATSFRT